MTRHLDVVHDREGNILALVAVDIPDGGADLSLAPEPGRFITRLDASTVAEQTGATSDEDLGTLARTHRLDRHANRLIASGD
jgi:hypothetical protein